MATTIEQQTALDESLVPSSQRLRIARSNFQLPSDIQSKEATLQVVYDVLRNSPLLRAFQIDTRKSVLDLEAFKEMLHISPRIPNQPFANLPTEEEILEFLRFLGHSHDIHYLMDVNVNKLYQPWRSFASVINKCLTDKSSGVDSFRLSQAQMLWGFYHRINIDFAYLIWEDFVYQVEHKTGISINLKKSQLLGVGIPDYQVLEVATLIGCSVLHTPFKYLGIMVGENMSSIRAWDETVNKLKLRLSSWKLKTLSIGGRLTLLKSVLGSTPIYNMSLFKVPKAVLKSMEYIRRNFFNGGSSRSPSRLMFWRGRSLWIVFLTRVNLHRRGVQVSSIFYPICCEALENLDHLLFCCDLAKDIARSICNWWGLVWNPDDSYRSWLSWFNLVQLQSSPKQVLEGVFYTSGGVSGHIETISSSLIQIIEKMVFLKT
nr:RNA-directed DNA polymerase, eukaryota [Tanacetum cinerariifolium]